MAIEFSSLVNPESLTVEFAILIIGIYFSIVYLGVKLRSGPIIFVWVMAIVIFILTFIVNLPFIWFWIMIILSVITIAGVSISRTLTD